MEVYDENLPTNYHKEAPMSRYIAYLKKMIFFFVLLFVTTASANKVMYVNGEGEAVIGGFTFDLTQKFTISFWARQTGGVNDTS